MNSYPQFPGQGGPGGPGGPGGGPGGMGPGMGPGAGIGQSPMSAPADVSAATKGKKGKKPKDPKQPGPQTAAKYRVMFLLALIAAVAFYALTNKEEPSTYVVRAAANIGALNEVTATQLEAVEIQDVYVEQGAITGENKEKLVAEAMEKIAGPALYPIAAGQQIRPEMFSNTQIQLDEALAPDERLMSIRASIASSVAGTIRPGDKVDIIATSDDGEALGNIVALNVPIVAVTTSEQQINAAAASQTGEAKDQKPADLLPGAPIPGIYIIKVKADQITPLAVLDSSAQLYLAYRTPDSLDPAPTGPVRVNEIICGGVSGNTANC